MKTRKIFAAALAGLCAVSTMGVSAFAADEKVDTAGAKSYKVNAAFQAPTIDVSVPEEILGVINPYKIAVVIDGNTFESEGVASPRYTITNNSTEVGINIDATYSADGLDEIVATAAAVTDGGKKMAHVTLNSVATAVADDAATTTLDMTTTEQTGELLSLEQKATDKANVGQIWIGGDVPEKPTEKWTASDKLSINVVLDINPYNPNAAGGGNQGGPTITAVLDGITLTGDVTALNETFDADTLNYTATCRKSDRITIAAGVPTGYTATYAVGGEASWRDESNHQIEMSNTAGDGTVTITVTKDGDSDDTQDYVITFTST